MATSTGSRRRALLPGLQGVVRQRTREGTKVWRRVGEAIRAAWIEELDKTDAPARWKRAYARCIKVKEYQGKAVVTLDTSAAKGMDQLFTSAIENGIPVGGIDMKPWLLKGRPYVDIPLGHTEDKRAGYKPTAGHTKTSIERLLTGLSPGERAPKGMVERLQVTTPKGTYTSVTDPLARALRQTEAYVSDSGKSYGREGSIYTIRRISKNSDPKSWHWARTGRRAHHLARKIQRRVAEITRAALGIR